MALRIRGWDVPLRPLAENGLPAMLDGSLLVEGAKDIVPFACCLVGRFAKFDPHEDQDRHCAQEQPGSGVRGERPGRRTAPPARPYAWDEQEEPAANAQVAGPSLLVLPPEEASARLTGAKAPAINLKSRCEQVNHYAQVHAWPSVIHGCWILYTL